MLLFVSFLLVLSDCFKVAIVKIIFICLDSTPQEKKKGKSSQYSLASPWAVNDHECDFIASTVTYLHELMTWGGLEVLN